MVTITTNYENPYQICYTGIHIGYFTHVKSTQADLVHRDGNEGPVFDSFEPGVLEICI